MAIAKSKYNMTEPVALLQVELWILETLSKGIEGLKNDYATIRSRQLLGISKTAYDKNPDKNRYPDVWCEDKTRVRLTYPPGRTTDYIHANFVQTPRSAKRCRRTTSSSSSPWLQ